MRSLDPIIVPRKPLGIAAVVLAALFLAAGGFLLYKAYGTSKAAPAETPPTIDPMTGEPSAEFKPLVQYRTEYILSGIAGISCALAAGACAGWVFTRPTSQPSPLEGEGGAQHRLRGSESEETPHPAAKRGDPLPQGERVEIKSQAEDRLALLATGGVIGGMVMALGVALFYFWFSDLTAWLNKEDKAKVWKPLTAMLLFLAGSAAMFLAAQPARGDERNSTSVRRLVYGVNLFIGAVLVFAVLLVINIVIGLKLPARFDTTEAGMYTISDATRDYISQLKQDVTIYSLVQDDGSGGTDIIRLLAVIREANPQRIKLRQLSQDLDKAELSALATKHKELRDPTDGSIRSGLLFQVGDDDGKSAFVRRGEFFGTAPTARGAKPREQFQGESRIAREILFLTENKSKPVVYFTQGAGEIAIEPAPAEAARSGEQLKTALVADGCEVKPLKFDSLATDSKVPDDASIVIVADPMTKLAPSTANALRAFMMKKRPDGTMGKLVVISGANPAPGAGGGMLQIGVEEFLDATYGVQMPSQALYAEPTNTLPPEDVFVMMHPALTSERNTLALAMPRPFSVQNSRRIAVKPPAANGPKAQPLLITVEDRWSWYEAGPVPDSFRAHENLMRAGQAKDVNYLKVRDTAKAPRTVAAIVSDPPGENTPAANRLVVYGFGSAFEDAAARAGDRRPIQAELLSATVNWLRDRPAIANETNKPYGVYEPNRKMSWDQVFTLPVAVTLIGLTTMGIGLWAWRRK